MLVWDAQQAGQRISTSLNLFPWGYPLDQRVSCTGDVESCHIGSSTDSQGWLLEVVGLSETLKARKAVSE